MEIFPKLVLSYSNLENLLETPVHELWPWKFYFALVYVHPSAIKISFK
jgi:hypothetical protein